MGTVPTGKQKEAFFAVLNYNPVTVELRSWGTNLTGGTVEFVGIEEGNATTVLQRLDFRNMTSSVSIFFFIFFSLSLCEADVSKLLHSPLHTPIE